MHQAMQKLLRQEDLCVLATSSPDGPHCSLMAYICDEDCVTLFMVTLKDTRKFINLQGNDTVSVLIDNRLTGKDRQSMQALTVRGRFRLLSEQAILAETRRRFLAGHPHLTAFASRDDACFFAVDIESLQLLTGATDACYETLGK
jgi:nitroimidazol reductase NimA-like FMN-containing flavoprotein (pyridoxamine 5'-phosphate oxidase superfamily)